MLAAAGYTLIMWGLVSLFPTLQPGWTHHHLTAFFEWIFIVYVVAMWAGRTEKEKELRDQRKRGTIKRYDYF